MIEDQLGGTPATAANDKGQQPNGKMVKTKAKY
jgi:hypothetical protein